MRYNKKIALKTLVLPALLVTIVCLGARGQSAADQSFSVRGANQQAGMLMSLTASPGVVQPASQQDASNLVGVLTPGEQTLDARPGQETVKTDGLAQTLVSTLGGNIKAGDRIGPSSLVGVGSKLTGNGWVVGTAQSNLDARTAGAILTTVQDNHQGKHAVYVATIPVVVKVQYYTVPTVAAAPANVKETALERVVDSMVGKRVSRLALILGSAVLLIGVIMAGLVVSSAIHAGLLAVSRQPLTKQIIMRKVVQSIGVGLAVLVVSAGSAYLLMRLF